MYLKLSLIENFISWKNIKTKEGLRKFCWFNWFKGKFSSISRTLIFIVFLFFYHNQNTPHSTSSHLPNSLCLSWTDHQTWTLLVSDRFIIPIYSKQDNHILLFISSTKCQWLNPSNWRKGVGCIPPKVKSSSLSQLHTFLCKIKPDK